MYVVYVSSTNFQPERFGYVIRGYEFALCLFTSSVFSVSGT